ncbi:MAG: phosphoribosylanthranilate isomerase [Candidatus Hydrogenedentota bacterium]
MTKVKICGITNLEDALAACEAGADALGFVFAEEARARNRYIEPQRAAEIVAELPPFVTPVAVCVNAPAERLRAYLSFAHVVQLCGEEAPMEYQSVADRAIKVFHAGPGFTIEHMADHPARSYLLDAQVAGAHGGTGTTCDWASAQKAAALGKPVILAGGLTPENVAEAVKIVRPYAVDTSGGVEASPGKKDHEQLRKFIRAAKSALSLS